MHRDRTRSSRDSSGSSNDGSQRISPDAQRQLQEEYDYYSFRRLTSPSPPPPLQALSFANESAAFVSPISRSRSTHSIDRSELSRFGRPTSAHHAVPVPDSPPPSYSSRYATSYSDDAPVYPLMDNLDQSEGDATYVPSKHDEDLLMAHNSSYEQQHELLRQFRLAHISPVYSENEEDFSSYRRNELRYQQDCEQFVELHAPPLSSRPYQDTEECYENTKLKQSSSRSRYPQSMKPTNDLKKPPPPSSSSSWSSTKGAVTMPPIKTIEISDGVHLPLRDADETMKAVLNDFYVPCNCFGCDNNEDPIFCIQDADFVVCPLCKTVSALEGGGDACGSGGVGLGFTLETLSKIQFQADTTPFVTTHS